MERLQMQASPSSSPSPSPLPSPSPSHSHSLTQSGKLNLCLRLMEEYKRGQAAEQAKGAAAYEDFLKVRV